MQFKETQKFTQLWVWAILISIGLVLLFEVYSQIIEKDNFGSNPISNWGLIISTILYFILLYFFYNIRLVTDINEQSIKVNFIPFFNSEYKWEQISKINIKPYSAIKNFGGYGIRHNFKGTTGLILGGKYGLEIELISGEKIFISTQKDKELREIINKINSQYITV